MTAAEVTKSRFDNGLQFTQEYFYQELNRLREQMGLKTFWQRPKDQRDRYLDGLGFVYLNIVNDDGSLPKPEQIEKWAMIYDATITEFQRRELFIELGI